MMQLLDPAGYRQMPWANGRGVTTEIARADDAGGLLWRLSMAQVVENGAFSLFPGIDRSLTVISGPGFALAGPGWLRLAGPLVPVGFAGDVAVAARDVTGPAVDFNAMWRRDALRARVRVATGDMQVTGSVVAVLALSGQRITVDDAVFQVPAQGCLIGGDALSISAESSVILVELITAR